MLETGDSVLLFSTRTIDFGTIYETDTARVFSFPFRNLSAATVVVRHIVTNCGCIQSYCDRYEFEPDEEGCLYVKFNPKGRSGTVDNNIFVYGTLSDSMPLAKLTLLGNVVDLDEWKHLPLSMGHNLRVKHRRVVFEPVRKGTSPQMRIPCANVGTSDLCLTSILRPGFVELWTEPSVMAPGEEGDIVIVIDGNKLPEKVNERYSILVEGLDGRVSDRTIEIVIGNEK